MWEVNVKKEAILNLYIVAVALAGILICGWALWNFNLSFANFFFLFFFLALTLIAELLPVPLPNRAAISVSFAIVYGVILLSSPLIAALIAFGGASLGTSRFGLRKALFNGSQYALSAYFSGRVFELLGGYGFEWTNPQLYIAIVLSVLTFFAVNAFLVMGAISLSEGVPLRLLWKQDINGILVQYFALFPLSVLLYLIHSTVGYAGILLFFFPLLVARYSFKLYVETKKTHLELLRALTAALDAKDPYTQGHSLRVAQVALKIASRFKLPERRLEMLEYAALLHDVGKIGIKDAILLKPQKLTASEYEVIKTHPLVGYEIVANVDFLREVAEIIRSHHERCDGSGYPDGKRAEELSLEARILAVADAFDALTSDRPYRRAFAIQEALQIMKNDERGRYDQEILGILEAIVKEEGKDQR
ncbi:HD-GYP domain-containing protein [Atrimonas thermophila]|jgi:putative nucleotidyltransferase with HDIG domain|uniref:HD-GYP domain-containing protein n=1 Tax=Atrimonas thermophila TaxID=3064161 RepID=UPI00399D4F3B